MNSSSNPFYQQHGSSFNKTGTRSHRYMQSIQIYYTNMWLQSLIIIWCFGELVLTVTFFWSCRAKAAAAVHSGWSNMYRPSGAIFCRLATSELCSHKLSTGLCVDLSTNWMREYLHVCALAEAPRNNHLEAPHAAARTPVHPSTPGHTVLMPAIAHGRIYYLNWYLERLP